MPYEKFDFVTAGKYGIECITVGRGGTLGISVRAYEKYLQGVDYVFIFYDKEKKRIGLQPTPNNDPNGYHILHKPYQSIVISARAFFRHFNIPVNNSTRCKCEWNKKLEMVEIDISIHLDRNISE